jgi:hypothetical protein
MASVVNLVDWFEGLFDDLTTGVRSGVMWSLDRAEPPLTVHVQPADRPTLSLRLNAVATVELRAFAAEIQGLLSPLLGVALPSCPAHGAVLDVVEAPVGSVSWRCKEADFSCVVGDYKEALWPPGPDEPAENLAPLLGHHLKRRGVMRGVASWSVRHDDGALVGNIDLRPGADEAAVVEAAYPVRLNVSRIAPVTTARFEEPATEEEPARRVLTTLNAPMHLALLRGTLRGALPDERCDVIVESHGSRIHVRLLPEHRLGAPREPLLFDHLGLPFADDGDEVACTGGFGPTSRIEGDAGVFVAGQITVYERPTSE